jgi:glyoxylase-like metal-dependent hydrolase (beta-lactamase superfamily II)
MNPHPFMASTYDKTFYRTLDLKVIHGDTDILEGVKALYTPGHSPGNQSVCVETLGD